MDGFTALRVQVLGEVSAWRGGDPIALGPASRRAVLGLLALAGGQPLGRIELLAGVWNGRPPPPTAVNVLQSAADEGRDTETVATGVDTVDLPRSARPLARPGRQPARRGRGGRAYRGTGGPGRRLPTARRAYTRMKRLDAARTCLNDALDLYRDAGDRTGQANTHLNAALVWEREGDHRRALEQARTALGLFTADSDRARARNAVGWYHALLGEHGRAMMHGRAALYKMEAALYRALGDRHIEVIVLTHLGEAHQARGAVRAARRVWRRSLAILGDLDPSVAQGIRTALKNTNRD